jgi:4-hydroxy-tetrahydrodipicolinate reductase
MRMNTPVRIAILGATGRMGHALIDTVLQNPGLRLAAAVALPGSAGFGGDAAALAGQAPVGVIVSDDLNGAAASADVLVDFSRPEATLVAVDACLRQGKPLVIGTTGFGAEQRQRVADAARTIPICMAANFSVGVNVCLRLLELAAQSLGDDYDVEIFEAHHRSKVDAPSGTALRMGEAVAKGLGRRLEDCARYSREGHTGVRDRKTIGFATVRGGDVIGDHAVMFLGEGERVEITHKASSRNNFARGALRAAQWLRSQPPGLYEMRDVLGLGGSAAG